MKKTFKNRLHILVCLVLMFTLISTCMMTGTLAKYVSTASGTDTARVAKWGFIGINTVDIFSSTYVNAGTVTTVRAANGTDKVVAPGTSGGFTFGLASGTSEVATKVTFAVTETNTSAIPIVYSYGGNYYSNVLSGTAYLKVPDATTFTAVTIAGNLAALATVFNTATAVIPPGTNYTTALSGALDWYWAFEQDATNTTGANIATRDAADTTLGAAGTATVTLNVTVTAEQVD